MCVSLIGGQAVTLAEEAQTDVLLCSFSLYERTQISPACAPTVRLRISADWTDTLGRPGEGTSDVSPPPRWLSLARCICPSGLPRRGGRERIHREGRTKWWRRKERGCRGSEVEVEVVGQIRGGRGVCDEEGNSQIFRCAWRLAACGSDQVASE